MRLLISLLLILPLWGCGGTTPDGVSASSSKLVLVRPYRDGSDRCHLVGESPDVQEYLDDHADLVGCPSGYDGLPGFENETGAIRLGAKQGYVLYTILR